jgi:branched-chain amino acid transport system permease protein
MAPVGVDEWVARSGDKREQATGLRGLLERLGERVGWWPRLALLAIGGFVFAQLGINVNEQTVAFNSVIYAILAVGLNITVGWAGLLDLGYVAFFGFGAYGYALFSSHAFGTLALSTGGIHLPVIATIPIVLVGAGILGVLIGLVALRLEGDYLAIVTLFVGTAFVEAVNNIAPSTLGGNNGLFGLDPFHALGGRISSVRGYYYLGLIMLIVLLAALRLLENSRTGRAWRALRDDPLAAEVMTIPVNALKVMAFSFGAIVAALAGTLFAGEQDSVFPPDFQSIILITIYACLVLGGVGGLAGAVLGGITVTVAEALLSSPTDSSYLFYGLIVLAIVARVRPWRRMIVVLGAIVGLGLAARAIVGAISNSAVSGSAGTVGWIGRVMHHYVIVPSGPASLTYGKIMYAILICALILLVQLKGIWRLIALVPTVYVAACCWESLLIVESGTTAVVMLGAILVVMMAARPHGLLGQRKVEVV